jgi:LysM repeat protein
VRYARDRHTLCKKLEAPPVPSPYTPPLARRAQAVKSGRFRKRLAAVESAGRRIPPRWRWLVPLIGLVPILVAVVLASEGVRLGGPSGQPVATGAVATSTAVAGRPAPAVAGVPLGPTPITGQAGTNATTGQPSAAQPGGTNGAQTTAGQPNGGAGQTGVGAGQASTAPTTRAADGTSASQPVGAGAGSSAGGNSTIGGGATVAGQGNTIATSGPFRAYAVQPGDTVKFVAQMYGVSPASISQASGLQNPDQLRIGQVLTIPAQPGWLYRVQPGESLDQIAARTGVTTAIIASASNLATDSVRAGDVILIPDRAGAVTK